MLGIESQEYQDHRVLTPTEAAHALVLFTGCKQRTVSNDQVARTLLYFVKIVFEEILA